MVCFPSIKYLFWLFLCDRNKKAAAALPILYFQLILNVL